MASFNVSARFGLFMLKQGFQVESNKEYMPHLASYGASQRPMRLFAPAALKGKAAKKWFNKVFWCCHNRVIEDNYDGVRATY
jgi:hypothetical protein